MGYHLIIVGATIGLVFHHVIATRAPTKSKVIVSSLFVLTIVLSFWIPSLWLPILFAQLGISIYALFYLQVAAALNEQGN